MRRRLLPSVTLALLFCPVIASSAAAQCLPYIASLTLVARQVDRNPVTLDWTLKSLSVPSRYLLHVGTAPAASDVGVFDMGLATTVTAFAPTGMRLYVRVTADVACGGDLSNEVTFVAGVPNVPGSPELFVPPGGNSGVNPLQLAWRAGSGGTPLRYVLQVGTSSGAADVGSFDMGLATAAAGRAPLDVPLFARVVAQNAAGATASNELILTATSVPPPGIQVPPVVEGTTVRLNWIVVGNQAADAAITLLVRYSPTGPIELVLPVGAVSGITVPNVAPGTYYVSAIAQNEDGQSGESNQVTVVVP